MIAVTGLARPWLACTHGVSPSVQGRICSPLHAQHTHYSSSSRRHVSSCQFALTCSEREREKRSTLAVPSLTLKLSGRHRRAHPQFECTTYIEIRKLGSFLRPGCLSPIPPPFPSFYPRLRWGAQVLFLESHSIASY